MMLPSFCFQWKLVLRPQDRHNVRISIEDGIPSLSITKSIAPGLIQPIAYGLENTKRCFFNVNQLL